MRFSVVVFLAALAASSCATPYQEMGFTGGVQAQRVSDNMIRITALGNAFTDPDTIYNYSMRKAAEETVAAGYDWFGILGSQDRTRTGQVVTGGSAYTTANVTASGNSAYGSATTTYTPPTVTNYSKPGQSLMIEMGKGEPPRGAFDARKTLQYLAPPTK